MGELLVEEGAQAIEFGFVAEFVGGDLLVEFLREDVVVDFLVEIVEGTVRPLDLARRFGLVVALFHEVVFGNLGAVGLALFHLLVGGLVLLSGRFLGAGVILGGVLVLLLAAGLLLLRGTVLVLGLRGIVAQVFGDIHG